MARRRISESEENIGNVNETMPVGMMRFGDMSNNQEVTDGTSEITDVTVNRRKESRQHKTSKRMARCRSGAFTAVR